MQYQYRYDEWFCTSAFANALGCCLTWLYLNLRQHRAGDSICQSQLLSCSRRWSRLCLEARCLVDIASIVYLDTSHLREVIPRIQHSQSPSLCFCTVRVLMKPWQCLFRIAESIASRSHHCTSTQKHHSSNVFDPNQIKSWTRPYAIQLQAVHKQIWVWGLRV